MVNSLLRQPFRPLSPFLAWPPFLAAPPFPLPPALHGLEMSQWDPPAALTAGVRAQLRLLLEWAVNHAPHYRRTQGYADVLAGIRRRPDDFDLLWSRLPVLTKTMLREDGRSIEAAALPAGHSVIGRTSSSGSTGITVEVPKTPLTNAVWKALTMREHFWRRRNFSRRLGVVLYRDPADRVPGGVDLPNWGSPAAEVCATGAASAIHSGYPIAELAVWMRRFDPHYLQLSPSIAAALLDEFRGTAPPSLEEVRLLNEPVDPVLEARLGRQWGVRCAELYSADEVGCIAFRCREHDSLHVQSEAVHVEILDDAGNACAAGETGRVVVTPLHNLAAPLVRYDIGDYATVGTACACGRALPVLARIRGRVRNLVRMPDGSRRWASGLDDIAKIAAVRQAQFVQTALERIELRLVLRRPLSTAERAEAVAFVQQVLGHPFDVEIAIVDAIERGPTGKFEEFRSLLP